MSNAPTQTARPILFAVALLAGASGSARGEDLDSVMYRDPEVPVAKVVKVYPKGLTELWLVALDRPDRESPSRAALAIAEAHEGGMTGLNVTIPALVRLLDRPDQHPAVLSAAVRALAALDARDAAPAFLRLAKSGNPDVRDAIELTLARWDHKPARDLWIERIGQPPPHGRGALLAVRCLGTVRDERAAPRLRELALAPDTPPPLRLAAARALGEIRKSGSEADAAQLAGNTTPRGATGRLVGAALLRRHEGAETIRLLQKFAQDTEPAVAAVAVTRLSELGTKFLLPVLTAVLASPDAEVREHGIEAMFRNPSDDHARELARAFNDPHPAVRVRARQCLCGLADARRALVIERGVSALTGNWRGQEQAAILLGQLGHKPAAGRLVELLKASRPEVFVAAAWGLRQLAVPETLPKVLEHVRARHADLLLLGTKVNIMDAPTDAVDQQLSHLIQFIGHARYRAADSALRALVPRIIKPGLPPGFTPVGPAARAAAIWGLGLLHEGKPDDALATLLEGRITGDGMFGHDDERVRRMSALALGRMGSKRSLEVLRNTSDGKEPSASTVPNACRWALNRLTGEPIPEPGVVESVQRDWFLVPLK